MTSVNGVTAGTAGVTATTIPEALSSTAAVSAGAAAGSAANLQGFLDFIAAATDGASSGMRAPANPEDAEALLLLVESRLDKTVSQTLGATAAARLGQAQAAGALSAAQLVSAFDSLSTAQSKLASAKTALATDSGGASGSQTDLQDQLDAVNAQILQQVAKMQSQAASSGSGTSAGGGSGVSAGSGIGAGDMQALQDAQGSQASLKGEVEAINDKLAGDDPASFASDATMQAQLQRQLDAANTQVALLVGQQVAQVQGQASNSQSDESDLSTLVERQSALQTELAAATQAVATDIQSVGEDYGAIAASQTRIASGISALSRIATGLRGDLQQQTDTAAGTSKHRDIAYDETADIAKRHRDGEVARARRDDTHRAEGSAKRDEDSGGALAKGDPAAAAEGYLAAVADALATLRAFVAAPPPTVSQTAATEAGGRLRLAL